MLCVLAEDVENHCSAIDDLDLDDIFERTTLAGREFRVGDDRVCVQLSHCATQFLSLATAEICARIGVRATL